MQSLWMLVATFLFSLMGVCVKFASATYSTGEIVFYRGLVGAVAISLLCGLRGGVLRTPHLGLHLKRSVVGLISMCLWFYTMAVLPLPTAMTLAYTSPLWIAAFLVFTSFQSPRKQIDRWSAAIPLCGFVGVALLLQPTFDRDLRTAGILGVIGAFFAALAYEQVRAVARAGEPEWRIVFYFSLGSTVVGFAWALATGLHRPTPQGVALLLAIGVFALAAQIALTRALARGNTLLAATLQYSGVLFAAMWGIMFWNDMPDAWGWLGMALIVLCGIASTCLGAARSSADS